VTRLPPCRRAGSGGSQVEDEDPFFFKPVWVLGLQLGCGLGLVSWLAGPSCCFLFFSAILFLFSVFNFHSYLNLDFEFFSVFGDFE
jgi:hypothetical protein